MEWLDLQSKVDNTKRLIYEHRVVPLDDDG